jgi:hypothetical protein
MSIISWKVRVFKVILNFSFIVNALIHPFDLYYPLCFISKVLLEVLLNAIGFKRLKMLRLYHAILQLAML